MSTAIEILIVEDNPGDLELTLRTLRKHQLANHIEIARDGAEALDFIFATGNYAHRRIMVWAWLLLIMCLVLTMWAWRVAETDAEVDARERLAFRKAEIISTIHPPDHAAGLQRLGRRG